MEFIRRSLCLLLAWSIAGCAGVSLPQQARFQPGEPAGLLLVQSPVAFFTPHALTFNPTADGVVAVHAVSSPRPMPPAAVPSLEPLTDDALTQLDAALLPFLVPVCAAPLPR